MEYKVTDEELTSIANAIRAKANKTEELIFPTDFVSEIGNISTGTNLGSLGIVELKLNENIPTNSSYTFTHNLGAIPNYYCLFYEDSSLLISKQTYTFLSGFSTGHFYGTGYNSALRTVANGFTFTMSENTLKLDVKNNYKLAAGNYYLIYN